MNAATKIAVDPEIWILGAEELVPDFAPCAAVGAGVVAESVAIARGPTEGAAPIFAASESVKYIYQF